GGVAREAVRRRMLGRLLEGRPQADAAPQVARWVDHPIGDAAVIVDPVDRDGSPPIPFWVGIRNIRNIRNMNSYLRCTCCACCTSIPEIASPGVAEVGAEVAARSRAIRQADDLGLDAVLAQAPG